MSKIPRVFANASHRGSSASGQLHIPSRVEPLSGAEAQVTWEESILNPHVTVRQDPPITILVNPGAGRLTVWTHVVR